MKYPPPDFRIKSDKRKEFIFDRIRKRWVTLTPEEWVRQQFIGYLIKEKNIPPSLIVVEKEMVLGSLKKRFDILIYDRNHKPWMLVECKAPDIMPDDKTLFQILRYNIAIPVRYIVITNGPVSFAWERTPESFCALNNIPSL
ncbi:MAG: type I restriction enzyme HsdR N-terminal domain-containing protein [Chitinophagaceae bacterium]|nr:type I restriction enzyme HsdR N-terminal domain-containing protein [Chitinophagaceae bacterium]